jgi:hypothetical protein
MHQMACARPMGLIRCGASAFETLLLGSIPFMGQAHMHFYVSAILDSRVHCAALSQGSTALAASCGSMSDARMVMVLVLLLLRCLTLTIVSTDCGCCCTASYWLRAAAAGLMVVVLVCCCYDVSHLQ